MSVKPGDTALISKALDGRITAWDEEAEKMFGFMRHEAIGKHISIVIPFDFQDEEYEILDRLKDENSFEVRETVRRNKKGEFFLVKLSATPLRDSTGKIVGAQKKVVFVQDLPSAEIPSKDSPIRKTSEERV